MKKNLLTMMLFSLCACLCLQAWGQEPAKGIAFEKEGTTFEQACMRAAAAGKLLFVDCYTSWCGPCKMMANTVFPQEIVGNYMNPKYVSLKMDMEKGEGPALAKKWQISAYPTFIVFNGGGQELGRFLGGCKAEDFIQKIEAASVDNSSAEMDQRFANGERDEAFLYSYLETLGSAFKRDQCNLVAEALLEGKAETFAADKQLADVFIKHLHNPFCPAFIYTAKHPEALSATVGENLVNVKLQNVWQGYQRQLIDESNGQVTLDRASLDKWVALMEECGVEKETREELRMTTLINYYEKKQDWKAYVACMKEYNETFDMTDLMLCRWCKPIAENCKEEAPRQEMRAMMQQRLDDLQSGRRAPQTRQGGMMLSGNLQRAIQMMIDVLDGKEITH